MSACLYCNHENVAGSFYCANCGKLTPALAPATLDMTEILAHITTASDAENTHQIDPHKSILIYVCGAAEPITVKPACHSIYLGCIREVSRVKPDVDLTAYQASEKGVSKMHAALRRERETVTIEDLGSANGTYVNGQALIPGQRIMLRHSDEVRLAHLVTNIYFT
jgi:hypothetical protein